MKFWVGVTDKSWFEFLRERAPDEVNFWQPSGKPVASFLAPGTPFLFKLHSPHNFIVGGGFFVRFSSLPSRLAWDAFGEKNGVESYASLRHRVEQYRGPTTNDPDIGCNILNSPFLWPEEEWIPIPSSWKPNIVRGKTFGTESEEGRRLWDAVLERLQTRYESNFAVNEGNRYGAEYLTHARLGQGAFRVLVTDAYSRKCAISGEKTLPVLEAAHIQPYAEDGPHRISNGLLLRSDLHTLFDRGYLTVADDMKVAVSSRIREEFENGREYYRYQGVPLAFMPTNGDERPARRHLQWHAENKYLG